MYQAAEQWLLNTLPGMISFTLLSFAIGNALNWAMKSVQRRLGSKLSSARARASVAKSLRAFSHGYVMGYTSDRPAQRIAYVGFHLAQLGDELASFIVAALACVAVLSAGVPSGGLAALAGFGIGVLGAAAGFWFAASRRSLAYLSRLYHRELDEAFQAAREAYVQEHIIGRDPK